MPLFEFVCRKCTATTEVLVRGLRDENEVVACAECGSRATTKVVSRVSFKVAKAAKYNEDFLHKARPFLRNQQQTAELFAEAKGSEDARTYQLAERIGEGIDRTLATCLPPRKR